MKLKFNSIARWHDFKSSLLSKGYIKNVSNYCIINKEQDTVITVLNPPNKYLNQNSKECIIEVQGNISSVLLLVNEYLSLLPKLLCNEIKVIGS